MLLMIKMQSWWTAVIRMGNLNPRPEPNIHLLYMEMDKEKEYHPRMHKVVSMVLESTLGRRVLRPSSNSMLARSEAELSGILFVVVVVVLLVVL